ncbi:hypothetical protein MUG94_07030 [Arthrobacter gengyunqii]|uniref:Uncharacterized protein n=1 Tax=Arthrobacter gengyunqii TaxID=2886940 RepID=A0A9X1M488_9MICC|nr:hypothetical protein [Arthrobacter gengyunqii]MCC3270292.1 hypothetical protein [Arthrobacter gengyunqii]UOY97490.1 hypothetical protein MUG94_07030 [Arthrobacter gengyunqii]
MPKQPIGEKLAAKADAASLLVRVALAGALSIGLVSCSGDTSDQADDASTPTIAQATPEAEPSPSGSENLITDPVEYYREDPNRTPAVVRASELIGQFSGVGTQDFTELATTEYSNVTIFVTCANDAPYEVRSGTETDAEQYSYGSDSCGPGFFNHGTIPFDKGPIVSLRVEVPEDTEYTLTVYGGLP